MNQLVHTIKCFVLVLIGLGAAQNVAAVPNIITLQTKIMRPNGTALDAPAVNFQITTLDPLGSCALYVESFSAVSMTNSDGLTILNLGAGAQVFSSTTGAYSTVFNNQTGSYPCQAGGTYVPALSDRRKIVMQFHDGTAAGWQTTQAVDINSVPFSHYANDSVKLNGHLGTDYTLTTAFPDCNSAGKVLTFNGTAFTCVSPSAGSGTVTNVTSSNSYLTVATGTTAPALTVNVGTAANTVAAGNDTRITGALQKASNLSDVASAATSRTNLGSTTTGDALFTAASASAARTTLGLGTAAVLDAGAAATNLVQLDAGAKIPAALLPNFDASLITTGTIAANRLPASATFWQDAGSGKINYNGGNVGIGTATPTGILQVTGGTAAAATDGTNITLTAQNAGTGNQNGGHIILNPGANTGTGNAGGVYIGASITPAYKFRVTSLNQSTLGGFEYTANDSVGTQVIISKYRGGGNSLVNGDSLGLLDFSGRDSTGGLATSVRVQALIDGTPATGQSPGALAIYTALNGTGALTERVRLNNAGKLGIGVFAPTGFLHLKAGTAAAGTSPLKLTAGTNLTAAEAGAIEFDGTNLYFTDSVPTRRTIATTGGTGNSFTGVSTIANSSGNISLDPNSATGSVLVSSGTASVGAASGALVVTGGVGVGGAINSTGSISSGASISATTSVFTPQIYGSSAASGNIKVDGTSNATKGFVLLNSAGGNVGVGIASPTETFQVNGTAKLTGTMPTNKSALTLNQGQVAGTSATSISLYPYVNGSDFVTTVSGLVVDSPTVGGGGSFGNYYGLQILGSTAATTSMRGAYLNIPAGANNWNIYANSAAQNYFAGNVGIGTTAPTTALEVYNTGSSSSGSIKANDGTNFTSIDPNYGLIFNRSGGYVSNSKVGGSIILRTSNTLVNDTNALNIAPNGNVGIGVAAPAGTLEVAGGTATAATNGNNITFTAQNAGTGNQNGGSIVLTPGAKSGTGVPGAVLIGLTSAPSWIGPNSLYVTGTNYSTLGYQANNGYGMNFGTSSAGFLGVGGSTTADYISYRTNNTARLHIDGSGNIGVGTTTPAFKLDVAGVVRSSTGGFQFPDGTVMTTAGVGTSTGMTSATDLNFAADTDANATGEMIFATAGTERMRLSNGGAIGIGITTPSSTSKLNVQDASTKTPIQITTPGGAVGDSTFIGMNVRSRFGYDGIRGAVYVGDTNAAGASASKPIVFDSGGSERMRIDATGNVAIGTVTPGAKLTVNNDAGSGTGFQPLAMFFRSAGNSYGIALGYWADGSSDTASAIRTTGANSDLILAPNSSSVAVERLRVTSAGNVGVGTTAPTSKLHVASGAVTVDNDQSFVMTDTTGSLKGSLKMSTANNLQISNNSSAGSTQLTVQNDTGGLGFYTGSTPTLKMILLNSGNLGIGVTSPGSPLEVAGNISNFSANPVFQLKNSSIGGENRTFIGSRSSDSRSYFRNLSGAGWAFMSGNDAVEHMTILNTGSVGIGNTAPTEKLEVTGNIKTTGCLYYASSSLGVCASDERIKKDVHSFDIGLDALLGVNPVQFKYNGLAGFKVDEKEQLGVIAQQVEKVAPSLVKRQMVQLNKDDKEKTEIKVVDYGAFTYVIINSIKEFYAKWLSDSKSIHREIASVKSDADLKMQHLESENQQLKNQNESIRFYLCSKDPAAAFCK